jgi:hypothetical protein
LVDSYAKAPDADVVPKIQLLEKQEQLNEKEEAITKLQTETIPTMIKEEISKVQLMQQNEAKRFRMPMNYNQNTNPDYRIASTVPYSVLRAMAVMYPIARACINRRKSQIVQLEWEISTVDEIEKEDGFKPQIDLITKFFKQPMGHKTRMREMLNIMVDDILTVDATCFEYQKTRGGELLSLVPVDPTTIVLRLTDTGATPEPPEVAYAQYIAGQKIAEFTTDDMLWEMMSARSYSPYGLAPLESLILQCESALRGALYNLNYFRESNVPEGFITLPEEVASSQETVQQWQDWFDLMMSGDPRFMRRLKILPGGAEYTAAKKPEDMAFERFEMWLLQQTCAVFDVPPQDIGITYQVNKATADSQSDLSKERGLYPLANFIREILNDIIQVELGFDKLQWAWQNINPVDRKEEADIAKTEVDMGALSVDEYRINKGLEPIGLGHFIMTSSGPIMVDDIISGKYQQRQDQATQSKDPNASDNGKSKPNDQQQKSEDSDLRAWRKAVYKDLEMGRPVRTKFPSEFINEETHKHISETLEHVKSKFQAKILFDQFLDPEIKASMRLLQLASEMRKIEDADIATN